MITSAPGDAVDDALARALGMPVTPLGNVGDFHNVHFRATTNTGTAVFVKDFNDIEYWRRAIAATPIAEAVFPRTPRLLDHGRLGAGRWWLTYTWVDMVPFVATAPLLDELGAMVGRLHAETQGVAAGFERHDLDAEITARAAILAGTDPADADRILTLQDRWGPVELPSLGLIHGDLHFRNAGITDGGQPVLFDTQNMQAGHALLDFGKLLGVDGQASDAAQKAFMRGYDRHAAPVWPWPDAIRSVQLWVTAGVLVYSRALGLDAFAAKGYRRLSELETRR